MVGSDGSLQRGLHHEEEDLPGFVYDRIRAGQELPAYVKMETPVTYFYSERPLEVGVKVSFPHGIFSQWYPEVRTFVPGIASAGTVAAPAVPPGAADPFLDARFPFVQASCRLHYGSALKNGDSISGFMPPVGLLDWGTIDVLGRDEIANGPDAPLGRFTWGHARQVAANALRTASGQTEAFLFYRGLGDFEPPVRATSAGGLSVALANTFGEAIGPVFVLHVGAKGGAFVVHSEGIAPGATLSDAAPSLEAAPGLDDFVDLLGAAMTDALDSTGLYHDESLAMVNTWKRQWFRTPGVRVLYLAPQSWTDGSIPLTISPAPDQTRRTMMIRVEVLTVDIEQADVGAAKLLTSSDTAEAGRQHFRDLGRFAEPRLRRSLALLGSPSYGDAFLSQIATANTVESIGE